MQVDFRLPIIFSILAASAFGNPHRTCTCEDRVGYFRYNHWRINDQNTQTACNAYRNSPGTGWDKCSDCVYSNDWCHSASNSMGGDQWLAACKAAGSQGSACN
nr:uncharacterized protein CTRU02_08092 [Colletotrichum truncatum]KAF6790572.1 hypothetical protein CTRU02_08092 [Colletotrichum truncatum]